ncbi:MAG: GGDEF domain-containing protein [Treponema sp.]|nr:GGDEF domain-containing protein [Treponema sp.]
MNRRIAVLSSGWSSHFLKDFISGMMRAVEGKNIDIYLFNTYNYTEYSGFPNYTGLSIFNLINYDDFDGVVILSDLIANQRVLEKERLRIIKAQKPAITINKKLQGICCLRVDNYSGVYEALNHLIKMHNVNDIAYISGKETSIDISERYKAYVEVLKENNIKFEMEKVYNIETCDYHCAYNYFNDFIKSGKKLPQAFCCANDLIALALLKVCSENKIKIPEQLKIIGFDNLVETECTSPSITTVKNSADALGAESVMRLLRGVNPHQILNVRSTPVFRQSCGCGFSTTSEQKSFPLNILDEANRKAEFDSHMETLEEIFTEAGDVFTLLTNIENFFVKSHNFEGPDFCIFMKSDWTSVLINSAENLPQNFNYGAQVQSICSVQNNQKYLREMIPTRELIPAKMKTEDKSNVFLFLPIFHHSYVHGYFVAKNNLKMIDNRYGYRWSRNMGNGIELFRKRNMFKQMSQQYLRLSTKDALSGALNRQGLDKLAKPFYAQNKKNGLTTVLFFVDINKMKHINDQFGHLHGDLAVKTVAAAAMETVPKNWLCIRYGGDEFLIVGNSKNYNGEDYCTMIKERLATKTANMHLPYNLSASVGTYSVPPQSELTLEQAVETVDNIMYEQKQAFHKEHDEEQETKNENTD